MTTMTLETSFEQESRRPSAASEEPGAGFCQDTGSPARCRLLCQVTVASSFWPFDGILLSAVPYLWGSYG
jgi:hypothetical protein